MCGLHSFVVVYKVLSRVLHSYADLLDPLDKAVASKQPKKKTTWTDELCKAFTATQDSLCYNKMITMLRLSACLWIITYASMKEHGIVVILYIMRDGKLPLVMLNAKLRKLRKHEVEALCIGMAVKHFLPHIIESKHTTQVLTDSHSCFQARDKLKHGEFSTSSLLVRLVYHQ